MIHTVGDSHSVAGWSRDVKKHHIGPILCYSFGSDISRFDIDSLQLKPKDTVVFCLGEIDCRCHIHKHVSPEMSYKDIIDTIVDKYFFMIKRHFLEKNLNERLFNICIYNVIPPVKNETCKEDTEFPFLGSDEERLKYVLYFNKKIKDYCYVYKYTFFDVYSHYADTNGFLKKELSDNSVHIKNGHHLDDFIKQHALL